MIIKFNRLNFSIFTVKGCVQLFLVSACLFCFVLSNALTNFSQLEKVAFERFGGIGLEKTKAWQKFLLQASTQSDLAKVTLVNNVDEYAQAILTLIDNPERLKQYSAAALADADVYTLDNMVSQFMDGIVKCLAR